MSALATEEERAEAAAAGGREKREYVRSIFSQIAPRYDLLNHLLSFNIDRRWRRRALNELSWTRRPQGTYVDLCAGTLDVAAELARRPGFRGVVLGADFAEPMLRAGAGKAPSQVVLPVTADVQELPISDGVADGVIVAFGIRNVVDLPNVLREAHRVLTAGGRLVILEFSTPRRPLVRALYLTYFHRVLPVVGGLISRQPTAYRYLPRSVSNFPAPAELARQLEAAGFARVRWYPLTMGVATVHVGERSG